jgi:hypothetical protein
MTNPIRANFMTLCFVLVPTLSACTIKDVAGEVDGGSVGSSDAATASSNNSPSKLDAGLSLPVADNTYACDPTCVVTLFRQAVAGPEDCYCVTCPTAMPSSAATQNAQNYAKYCSQGGPTGVWAGHNCTAPYCAPMEWLCTCPDGSAGQP